MYEPPTQAGNPSPPEVSVRTLPIQEATATSYAAVCANAAAARACRWAMVNPPASRAATASAYWLGAVSTATLGWFFAAARTIDGPPMSICSTHSSGPAPEATVSVKGYRFTTTSSNAATPRSASWARWSGLRVSARIPA